MTLEIILPTYNHPAYIKEAVKFFPTLEGYDVCLTVVDSSTNDETKELISPFLGEKVRYKRVESRVQVDEKTVRALKEAEGDFVFLCGDRYFPNIKGIFASIDFGGTDGELFILYENTFPWHIKMFEMMDGANFSGREEFFQKHFWQATLYGGSICKRSIFERMEESEVLGRFSGSGFIYPCLLALYAKGPFYAMRGDFLISLPVEGESGWVQNKSFAKIWLKNYPEAVKSLSDVLEGETILKILRTTGERTNFLTAKGLAIFRISDNFNKKIYKEYKRELKEYRACSAFTVWLIATLPKGVFRFIRALKRAVKRGEKK